MREGLSFSDYFDDSIPPEVKPLPPVMPSLEEDDRTYDDYPNRAKDLYKGLWENVGEELLNSSKHLWLDKDGKFHDSEGCHEGWAQDYLLQNNIPRENNDTYETMFKLGFMRVYVNSDTAKKQITFRYGYEGDKNYKGTFIGSPTRKQMSALKDAAIEIGYSLYDLTKQKDIELNENTGNKSLFILENMMPNDTDVFKSHLAQLFAYLQKELKLKTIPKVKLVSDEKNAEKVLGKTAYYDPSTKTIVLFITNRHMKDILRSFSHECVHFWDHERGVLNDENSDHNDPQYAQHNEILRKAEMRAYLLGNMIFRDFEDQKKAKDKKSGKKGV